MIDVKVCHPDGGGGNLLIEAEGRYCLDLLLGWVSVFFGRYAVASRSATEHTSDTLSIAWIRLVISVALSLIVRLHHWAVSKVARELLK